MSDPSDFSNLSIRKVVIVGGGAAGWMAAAPLAQRFAQAGGARPEIVLVESPHFVRPDAYDPFVDQVDQVDEAALLQHFARVRRAVQQTAAGMPDHDQTIARHVKAAPA